MSLLTENRSNQTQNLLSRTSSAQQPQKTIETSPGSIYSEKTLPTENVIENNPLRAPLSLNPDTNPRHYIDVIPGFQLTFAEADQALEEYRNDFLPQFPFVPLPHRHAYDMHKEQSLLLRTVLLTCRPPSYRLRAAAEIWFRKCISHHIVVLSERRLEFLQAILVFLAWFVNPLPERRKQLVPVAKG